MKKILFLAILFGTMLVGGVAYAEDGTCWCNKISKKSGEFGVLTPQQVTLQKDFNNAANCVKQETEVVSQDYSYSGCFWIPAPKPSTTKPPSGGAPSGSNISAGAGAQTASPDTPIELGNPLGPGRTDIRAVLGDIIKYVMGIVGSLTLLVFVFGGFLWLTSAGNDERVKKGSQTMIWAVIGIFIIFASYGILSLVLQALGARNAAEKPWGSQTVGGPETQAGIVEQLKDWQCIPLENLIDGEKLDFDILCAENIEQEDCVEFNDNWGAEVCEYDNVCAKKMSEADFCAKFMDDKADCETAVSGACEVATK